MIWSSNTSLGKTLVSTGLASSFLLSHFSPKHHRKLLYLKPVQTAERENFTVSDSSLVNRLEKHLTTSLEGEFVKEDKPAFCIVETAGGVASPGPSGTLQCDLYRPFRLPGILVGDGRLGGISGTVSAYESLKLRGYDVVAVVFVDHGLANEDSLQSYFRNRYFDIELAREMGYAAGRFGHVMFPENVYEPSLECAQLLLEGVGKGWASRVFFSDNGSTAIEIALKMAFRKFCFENGMLSCVESSNTTERSFMLKVLALKGSYHGDTLGAMEAQAPSSYTGFTQQPCMLFIGTVEEVFLWIHLLSVCATINGWLLYHQGWI
ncbi:Bifunctional dethiobiotin synthetase/7,8-diamino-pelargonic acid aminotransferase, mitochondrial [Linum perenne]